MAARRSRRPAGAAVSGWPSRGDGYRWPFPRRSPRPHKPPAPDQPSVGLPRTEGGPVMGESFEEFIAAERALERQAWAHAEAARLPAAELASIDVVALREEIADCHANQ